MYDCVCVNVQKVLNLPVASRGKLKIEYLN